MSKRSENLLFSPMEQEVLNVLSAKPTSAKQLAEKIYKGKVKPFSATNNVCGFVRRINAKCLFYKLKWRVDGEGIGRGGRTIWIKK